MVAVGGNFYTDKCQVVDTKSTNPCTDLASYPDSIGWATGRLIDDSPLICAGNYPYNPNPGSTCHKYDRNSNSWNLHATLSPQRTYMASVELDGALFLIGGDLGNPHGHTSRATEYVYPNGSVISGPDLPPGAQAG